PGLLPPLALEEALEITRIYGVLGQRPPGARVDPCTARAGTRLTAFQATEAETGSLARRRPFRAPHHTTSYVGLVGGGTTAGRPGEVSLSHRGVLFLDELPEFPRAALEALREPLEARRIVLARAWGAVELPADFQLVAAMNPCPCGHAGDPRRA